MTYPQRKQKVDNMRIRSVRGYTLLELIVVMLLMSIFTTMGAPHFLRWLQQYRLHAAATVMTNHLRATRLLAIYKGVKHQMQLADAQGGNYYQVVEDPGETDRIVSTIGRVIVDTRFGGVILKSVPSSGRITFSPRGTSQNATIILENMPGMQIKIVINNFGRVKSESL